MDTALTRITATTLKSTLLNFKNDLVPRAMSEVIPECNAKSKPWAKPGMAQSQQWINKFKNNGMFGKHFLSSSLLPVPLSWAKGTWYSIVYRCGLLALFHPCSLVASPLGDVTPVDSIPLYSTDNELWRFPLPHPSSWQHGYKNIDKC